MPKFSTTPPEDPRGFALPLVRVPAGKTIVAIVISEDLIGCPTHFWGGRTVPCEEVDCVPCSEGVSWRWHSWLAAWSPNNDSTFLFESTRRITDVFCGYREIHGTLRGCHFRAQRRTSARNSRVNIELKPADLRAVRLPGPPNLLACMAIIWNIKLNDLAVPDASESGPRIRADSQPDQVKPLPGQLPLKFNDANRPKTA